jgi:hypothetical protein
VLREGVGMQYRQTRRRFSPVALLWSARSQRAAWIGGKMADFVKAESEAYTTLDDAGYDPSFISDVRDLAKKGIRALVLPMTLSVGRDERAALKSFVDGGGVVLATHPAVYDEFLRPAGAVEVAKPFDLPSLGAVRPWVPVTDVEGKPVPSVSVTRHAFPAAPDAELLTVLRKPVGQKEVIGADGVAHSLPDPSGGPPVLKLRLDVSGFAGKRFFDVRRRLPLEPKAGILEIDMDAGDGRPIAVLPYAAPALTLNATRENDRLTVSVSARVAAPHVIRLDVGGDPLLSRNLLLEKGEARALIALPLGTPELALRATDVLTGASASLRR